ncbi:type IV pilus modification PilV family protein [Nannocystaceae bacterium ST9]
MATNPPVRRLGIPLPKRELAGFTLLEVLVAVAILAISLTSLLGSQLNSIQATRYARDISVAALLAEWQIVELETKVRKEGFVNSDVEIDGDFADQGWDEFEWACTVHFVELPEYNQMIEAKEGADEESGKKDDNMVDAGDQMFGALGLVWPMVKAAIENSIRKVTCTVTWTSGNIDYEYDIQTFWTNPAALQNLPGAGGEFTEADDPSGQEGDPNAPTTSGTPSGGGTRPPSMGGGTGQMGNMGGTP